MFSPLTDPPRGSHVAFGWQMLGTNWPLQGCRLEAFGVEGDWPIAVRAFRGCCPGNPHSVFFSASEIYLPLSEVLRVACSLSRVTRLDKFLYRCMCSDQVIPTVMMDVFQVWQYLDVFFKTSLTCLSNYNTVWSHCKTGSAQSEWQKCELKPLFCTFRSFDHRYI